MPLKLLDGVCTVGEAVNLFSQSTVWKIQVAISPVAIGITEMLFLLKIYYTLYTVSWRLNPRLPAIGPGRSLFNTFLTQLFKY